MTKPTNSQIIQAVLDVIAAIGMALLALFKQFRLPFLTFGCPSRDYTAYSFYMEF